MPKPFFARLLPIAAAALILAGAAHAQRPGGFGGSPPMPPAMQAKMKAWETWRGTHKNLMALQRTLGGMTRLASDPQTHLTRPQAKAVLAVLTKWQAKPAVSDAQAKQINAQLLAPLTAAQRQQLTQTGRPGGGGRPGGFGGGRPGGGGFGGGRPEGGFNPAAFPSPREYNPLNPATQPIERSRDRAEKQHARLMTALKAAAK